jgi:hypothetical protein
MNKVTTLLVTVVLALFGAAGANAQGLSVFNGGTNIALSGGTQDHYKDYSADAGLDLILCVNGQAIYSPFRSQSPRPHFPRIPGGTIAFAATTVTTHPSGEVKRTRGGSEVIDQKTGKPVSNIEVISAGIYGRTVTVNMWDEKNKCLIPQVDVNSLPEGVYTFILKVALPMTRKERTTYLPGFTELTTWLGIFPNALTKVRNENGIIVVEQSFATYTYDGPDISYVMGDPLNYYMIGMNADLKAGWNVNGVIGSFAGGYSNFVSAPHKLADAMALYDKAMDLYGPYRAQLAALNPPPPKPLDHPVIPQNPLYTGEPLVVTAGTDEETHNPVWELTAREDVSVIILNRKGKEIPADLKVNTTTTVSKTFVGYVVTVPRTGERKFYRADGTPTTEEALRSQIQRP